MSGGNVPSWLRRSSPQPSHPTQGGSRKRRGRGLGSRWCHRRSLQQREVTWFGVSFCVWAFGAHTKVCARVCAVQCVERIVRAARRPRSVWRGADLLNMNELGVRVRSHTTSYTREQPSARTAAQKSTAQYFPRRYTTVLLFSMCGCRTYIVRAAKRAH